MTAVNAHNALARNAKTQTGPFCAVVTDHLAFLEVKRVKCLLRTLVPFFKNSNCRFFVVMVFGWLCGGHAGLRPRLEHQEHGFDKSNFCFKNLPNMADLPNHRCTRPASERVEQQTGEGGAAANRQQQHARLTAASGEAAHTERENEEAQRRESDARCRLVEWTTRTETPFSHLRAYAAQSRLRGKVRQAVRRPMPLENGMYR